MATVLQHSPGALQLGELLRAARERRGLTQQQVSSTTKIPRRHLDAIEHGDFSVVPEGPYRRGEVRAIAQAIGFDQAVAVARLDEVLAPPVHHPPVAPADVAPARAPWLLAVIIATAVAAPATFAIRNRQPAVASVPAPMRQAAQVHEPEHPAQVRRTAAPAPAAPASAAPAAVATRATSVPAAAHSSTLLVTSEPSGARVVVDGIGRGVTPITIQYLPMGEKRVRVLLDGYASQERSVHLTPTESATTLHVELRPAH
jgi:cytoskeletal protein RodZ